MKGKDTKEKGAPVKFCYSLLKSSNYPHTSKGLPPLRPGITGRAWQATAITTETLFINATSFQTATAFQTATTFPTATTFITATPLSAATFVTANYSLSDGKNEI